MLPRLMIILFSILLTLLISVFLLVKFLERNAVFFPGTVVSSVPSHAGLPFEDLYITTSDGIKINAWLVKRSSEASTIIFAHGNAGTMGERVMKVKFWYDLGCNVLVFDYRGYGHSAGKPTEKGIYLDAQAVYDYLQGRSDINQDRLIGYGASLGGVVIIDLASKRKLAAIITESTITSVKDMARKLYPMLPSFMMAIKFDSISKIERIRIPKLFLHSREDRTVPFTMGEKLFSKASEPKTFIVTHGGHNDGFMIKDPQVQEGIRQFLMEHSLL